MGASLWSHFVPYAPDIARALQTLRESVLRKGTFYWPKAVRKATTIEAVRKACGESGTHSVLDVERVVQKPFPTPFLKWHMEVMAKTGAPPSEKECLKRTLDEAKCAGSVAPLGEVRTLELFKTKTPDHAAVETSVSRVHPWIPRGCGVYLVIHGAGGTPAEIFFVGKTGD